MPRHFRATPNGDGLRIGIVLARFNQAITDSIDGWPRWSHA